MATTLPLQPAPTEKVRSRRWWVLPLAAALLIYLALALALARTKAPWCDEGQYTNSAYNLAFHGRLASNVIEPSGIFFNAYFKGIQQRTYIAVPNNLVGLAAWFRLFGFGIFSARCYSIGWGALTLLAVFYIVQKSFPDRRIAMAATFFTAIDFVFLWSTADARMDAAANALAFCSVAVYLHFREQGYAKALLYSQILGAAAVYTHPNSALVVLVLALLALHFDRSRIVDAGRGRIALALSPYLVFGLLWSTYILKSPGDFRAQFFATVAGHNSERLTKIFHPDMALLGEIDRHLGAYCIGGLWGGVMKGWMVVVPLLYLPALLWLLVTSKRQTGCSWIFTNYMVAMVLGITFLNGFKGYFYLIYVLPLYAAVLAAWLFRLWAGGVAAKSVAAVVTVLFVGSQLSISILHIRADEYHRDYLPTVRDLIADRAAGKTIVGTAALGFGLNYTGFHDDVRLGMYSGLDPDVIVIDRSYRLFTSYFESDEPGVFRHVADTLTSKYRPVAQHGSFWIFERASRASGGMSSPWMKPRQVEEGENGTRARRLFRTIFTAAHMKDAEESSL